MLLGLVGCAGRGETDLLHARLREQQQQLAETQTRLESSAKDLKHARRETETLRTQLSQAGTPGLLPEQSDQMVRVSALRINPMLTAGLDQNDGVGDDALAIQFSPVDGDGELIRLPGEITITVLDPQLDGGQREIARWTFSAAESREHWVRGFLGTGYQFTLPWPQPPEHAELVAHVALQTADGREFAASHILKITPPVMTADNVAPDRTETRRISTPEAEPQAPHQRGVVRESTNWTESTLPVYR
ncbi:MAG TPA: hypothetical protein VM165_09985 [Planctomycetaceae bacterium]|nr:hypothetical protein [Planctomycetaceae bacterium]